MSHRRRWFRYALVAVTGLAVTGAAAAVASQPVLADAGGAAPYVDMSNSQVTMLDKAAGAGLKTYTAAFVIGEGCNQVWGDTLPVGGDSNIDPIIAKARSEGAEPIISSGGAAGEALAWTCTDQNAIVAGYQKIIDSYKVKSLDFDVEGAAIADTAAAARNMQAMKTLQAKNSGLTFSMTVPVLPSGMTNDGVNLVKAAKDAGVKINVVNIMTMDYYQGQQDMGQAAIKAAQATLGQMKGVDSSYGYANIGITPMYGTNDDGSTFSLDNQKALVSWAHSNGVGRLSGWSVDRDQSCGSVAKRGIKPDASSTCSGVSQQPLDFTKAELG